MRLPPPKVSFVLFFSSGIPLVMTIILILEQSIEYLVLLHLLKSHIFQSFVFHPEALQRIINCTVPKESVYLALLVLPSAKTNALFNLPCDCSTKQSHNAEPTRDWDAVMNLVEVSRPFVTKASFSELHILGDTF